MIDMLERKDIISVYEQTGSIRATERATGFNRRTVSAYVHEYLAARDSGDEALVAYLKSEPKYRTPQREKTVLTADVRSMIDGYIQRNMEKRLRGDRKLIMTVKNMHADLLKHGHSISYPSVCNYVRQATGKGEEVQECYIRQVYEPGQDCEFDWGEFHLTIDGVRRKVYIAVFTLSYSNHRMAYLYLRQDTLAFLDSHRQYFSDMEHVPHRMVYDNMRVAVAEFVQKEKRPTDALLRMKAVYGFSHRFCNARSGNEKGHVEKSVDVVRNAAFSQVDTFHCLADAQMHLSETCNELNGAPMSVATMGIVERTEQDIAAMMPLKDEISSFEQASYHIDKYGTALIKGIHYSVPDHLVGRRLTVFIYCNRIVFYYNNKQVASHERTSVNGWKLDLMHYLRTFKCKPGSVAGSQALRMAEKEIRELFDAHFADNPQDFITLLTLAREKGLVLEDIIVTYEYLRAWHVRPSLDAFKQYLFAEEAPKTDDALVSTATSSQIEDYSMSGLKEISNLIANPTSDNHGTSAYN